MISNFFIDRPLFATVVSAFIVIAGLAAFRELPVAMYPNIAPPQISVSTVYPGASADVIAESVAAPLEQALNGVENMLYMRSGSSSTGTLEIALTFAVGTDPDISMINVQNRVQSAVQLLPEEVRRQGVTVAKSLPSFLMILSFDSPDGRYDDLFVSNYATLNVIDELRRIPGMGNVQVFGARDYSIRIWLQPDRLAELGLTPADVAAAVREQNTQSAAGRLGDEPIDEPVDLTLNVTTQSRLADPAEFERIIVRVGDDGQIVRLKDVARVELGARDYSFGLTRKGRPVTGAALQLAPDANALQVAAGVYAKMDELGAKFPAGLTWSIPYDTSKYVRTSMREVAYTFFEALALVFCVVWLFLYNLRATAIPSVAVPVSLIGTFAGMYLLGFSINSLTLFGMVLAIGIVVDDAIVVLENVERHMRDEHVSARDATRRAMAEVSRPVIAIVLVLNAVFLPVAFLGGLVGEMYRQFAITIAVSVTISGFVALTLTPAMCALLLKTGEVEPRGLLARFDRGFLKLTHGYTNGVRWVMRHGAVAVVALALMAVAIWWLERATPSALAPSEDQGYVIAIAALPPASSLQRTRAALAQFDRAVFQHPAYEDDITVDGLDVQTGGQRTNAGVAFVLLKDWSERRGPGLSSDAVAGALFGAAAGIRDAFIFPVAPPAVEGMSNTGGLEGFVQSHSNDYVALEQATQKLVAAAAQRKELAGVNTTYSAQVPRVNVAIDIEKAKLLHVSLDDVNSTLQSTFGALYVNDFNRDGRVYRVLMQSDAKYRAYPEDLRNVSVRSADGSIIPLTAIADVRAVTGPDVIERFNLFPSARLFGNAGPGYSSGQALAAMEELAAQVLPEGYTLAWSGESYQEKTSGQNTLGIFGLAVLMVFLILAAQYERITLPFAVILAVPFAVFGAFLAVWLRGLYNDLYLQIGLVTLVGLAAKNAILIVEFAAHMHRENGLSLRDAAVEAARLRFRPIVMTSLAFILGVLPLAISTGAGAGSRHSIGTGVIGGMLAATFIAVLFIPSFFVWTSRAGDAARRRFSRAKPPTPAQS
jgi:HAE1 family hydrophobic/amphiphilic exporter-1/multidrug efflux pump